MADPASGIAGDANGDGTRSGSADEFIEIRNSGLEAVDISGWYLSDAVKTRHTFSGNTFLNSSSYIVIFGGGSPISL